MYEAIYNVLGTVFGPIMRFIFQIVGNYGVAILIFTVFCRMLMLPSAISQQKNLAKNRRMQYKLRKITERYKDDKKRQQQEIQAFYQREGFNPMSAGCSGAMLLQFPIIFGLISAIYHPLKYALKIDAASIAILEKAAPGVLEKVSGTASSTASYLQLRIMEHINSFAHLIGEGADKLNQGVFDQIVSFADQFRFFGLNLGMTPKEGGGFYYLIPILAGLASFSSAFLTFLRQRKDNPEQTKNPMMGCMTFFMPLFSVFISISFPVGIGIYWIVSSLFAFLQMVVLQQTHKPQKMIARLLVEETVERRSRENSRKRLALSDK
ncbi:MAG: YidC/Oxa1 family membrane protein insertase [Oscillospiraceae bacterium]|nr:YidC/Oxa1 family membrane protein insertase [Oscillospiraceae bacterium]